MTIVAGVALALWLLAAVISTWVWLPAGAGPWPAHRTGRTARIAVLVVLALLAAAAAVLAMSAGPLTGSWRWLAGAVAATVAVLGGGAVTTSILALAASAASTTARVQRDVLRGGAWIGALERLALLGTLVADWPEGLAAIVAVKGLARYPELRTVSGAGTGANERFIIGTFASLGWAAACAWVLAVLIEPERRWPLRLAARGRQRDCPCLSVRSCWLGPAVALLDVIENLISFVLLANPTSVNQPLALIYSTAAALEFAGSIAVHTWTFAGLVTAGIIRLRPCAG